MRALSRSRNRRNTLTAALFLLPNTLGFLVFTAFPVLASLFISLFDWPVLGNIRFIGFGNYRRLLFEDPIFWKVFFNTAYYSFGYVALNVVVAMLLALWLTSKAAFLRKFYRAIFFVPVVTPLVATSLIWRWLYHPDFGLINLALGAFGIEPIRWLASTEWAMPAIILMSVWQGFGYNMVIFIAGLEGIPKHLIEAATIDGAKPWTLFWKITLPMLSPSLFFATVMTIIGSFQVFDQTLILTGGGPVNATNTMVLYLYQTGFSFYKMGYASAIAWMLFAVIFLLTMLQMRLQKDWVHYE
jgi:multiple sugar transport system permease protein